ncbi:MAG TPA: GNAT family N-acetyltransferase [Gaiellaceae bacterium]|nr:GNAT family N-acetyltransferase [Gaiellaceae bacterium]
MSDTLRTQRLALVPLGPEHADAYDERECSLAEEHWRAHGFGSWAVLLEGMFVGAAELHFAHPGVSGIATDEIETGWEIDKVHRGLGLATEAMSAAIEDVWTRARATHLVAYIRPGNAASHRVAAKLGFAVRGPGLTRSGDPMSVYELRAP